MILSDKVFPGTLELLLIINKHIPVEVSPQEDIPILHVVIGILLGRMLQDVHNKIRPW